MLRAKFHDHRTISSLEKRFLKVFTIYGHGGHLGRDLDHLYTCILSFHLPKEAPQKVWL